MVTQVAIEDLSTWLSNQPTNTKSSPYEIEITGLTVNNYNDIKTALTANLGKYVDLRPTELPSGITTMERCFYNCNTLVYSPDIPNTVTSLSYTYWTTSLKESPVIPNSVLNMEATFMNCQELQEAPVIPNSVTNLEYTFSSCAYLRKALYIPTAITSLNSTFSGCLTLQEVGVIPEGITDFYWTFANCSNLTEIKIESIEPNDVTRYEKCFYNCTSLRTFYSDTPYEVKSWLTSLYNESTDNIPRASNFYSCLLLNSPAEIPITNLQNELSVLPSNNSSEPYEIKITELTTENYTNIRTILRNNDRKYVDLSNTYLPEGITSLDTAFSGCATLINPPVIPNTVTSMEHTFYGCSYLIQMPVIPNGVTNLREAFEDCRRLSVTTAIPNGVTDMGRCFCGCRLLTEIPAIPSSVTNIEFAFQNTSITSSPTLPNGITSLRNTFYQCASLTDAPVIPSGVTSLWNTFNGCTSLTKTPVIPSGVTNFNGTFSDCTSLTEISFDKIDFSNITIHHAVFNNCSAISHCYSDEPYELKNWLISLYNESVYPLPVNPDLISYSFLGNPSEIPISSLNNELSVVSANTTATPFNIKVTELDATNYNSIKTALISNSTKYVDLHTTELPSVITNLDTTFENCTTLIKAPDNPSSATSMQSTYSGCTNLSEVPEIPYTVTSLAGLLNGCSSITEAPELPSVTSYQDVFNGCSSLEDISNLDLTGATNLQNTFKDCTSLVDAPTIPNTVTNMESTFEGCSSLTAVQNVPANVTNLTETFKNCSTLEEILSFEALLSVLKSNAEDCFYGCTSLTKIDVPASEITEETQWHVMALNLGQTTVKGRVYDKNGQYVTIPETTITKDSLVLPIITDELLFTSSLTDSDIYQLITNMINYKYGYFNKPVIRPDQKSFVLQADDPDNFVTNIPFGGGTDIDVYPSEQAIIDDLANLEVDDIVASDDPDENETIAILNAKIQELEEKLSSDDTYSTTEVKTNKVWIDGKPIYRKVLEVTSGATGSNSKFSVGALIDHFIFIGGYLNNTVNCDIAINSMTESANETVYVYGRTNNYSGSVTDGKNSITLVIGTNTTLANRPTKIILEYTKTTD